MYVLGCLSEKEEADVVAAMDRYPEVLSEVARISRAVENSAMQEAIAPDVTIRPFLIATINYMERLRKGEAPSFPAELNETSSPEDYNEWLNRPDMSNPENLEDFYARIIGYTPEMTTAIVWMKHAATQEVHTDEYEKFLILEGTCDIIVEDALYSLKAGDYFAIPLYKTHRVRVTSDVPCKAILQRIAA